MKHPRYQVVHTPTFRRSFDKLDALTQRRVLESLHKLEEDPYIGLKLKAARIGQWRLRVGDYRIRYDIHDDTVVLHLVKHRSEVYR